MKRIIGLLVIVFFLGTLTISAQSKQKFAHINSNELMKVMPGKDSAQAELQAYAQILEKQLRAMQTELETKYNDFVATQNQMPELMKQTKTQELQDLQTRMEGFQTNAQQDLSKKESELLQPIIDKAKKVIAEVAKEKAYTYVLDTGVGTLLYFDESDDILLDVKKKLGVQ